MSDAPRISIRRLSLCLSVANLEAMASWYQRAFGFVLERRKRYDAIDATVAYLRRDDMVIELLQAGVRDTHVRANPPNHGTLQGVSQLTFHVESAEAACTALIATGAQVAMAPVADADLGVHACFVRDPEGNLIELLQYDHSVVPLT